MTTTIAVYTSQRTIKGIFARFDKPKVSFLANHSTKNIIDIKNSTLKGSISGFEKIDHENKCWI